MSSPLFSQGDFQRLVLQRVLRDERPQLPILVLHAALLLRLRHRHAAVLGAPPLHRLGAHTHAPRHLGLRRAAFELSNRADDVRLRKLALPGHSMPPYLDTESAAQFSGVRSVGLASVEPEGRGLGAYRATVI